MNKHLRIIPFVVMLFLIVFLSIGFSAFQSQSIVRDIGGVVRLGNNIRITSITSLGGNSNNEANMDGYTTYDEYNVKEINSNVVLPSKYSTITYTVEITNFGDYEMALASIGDLPNDLEFKSINYTYGTKLCEGNRCNHGSVNSISFTIGYKSSVSAGSNNEIFLQLFFEFKKVYSISYVDFVDTTGLPTQIMEDEVKSINLGNLSTVPVSVTVTGASCDSTNMPTIVLSSASGNVVVTAINAGNANVEVIDNGDGTTTTITEITTENQDGSTTTSVNEVTTDSQGNVTSSSETTTTENTNGSSTTTTVNYDANGDPTTGSTSTVDTSGNTNTQEVEYNNQGDPVVTGYTIDTSDNSSGGETITSGLDTGMLVFDGSSWTATLTAKINMDNITSTSGVWPVINCSKKASDNKIDGVVIYARKAGGTVYNETTTKTSASNSSPAMRFKVNKYNDGSVDSNSVDFYSKQTTAYQSQPFGTKTIPVTLTFKLSCSNNIITAEIWYNNQVVAKPRYSRTYGFTSGLDGVTFELGKFTANGASGTTTYFSFEVIEFSVQKS